MRPNDDSANLSAMMQTMGRTAVQASGVLAQATR